MHVANTHLSAISLSIQCLRLPNFLFGRRSSHFEVLSKKSQSAEIKKCNWVLVFQRGLMAWVLANKKLSFVTKTENITFYAFIASYTTL